MVEGAGDSVSENLNEGWDTVESSISYTLGANLENLTLTGTAAINGTGNTLNNSLIGNSAGNILTGGAGMTAWMAERVLTRPSPRCQLMRFRTRNWG